MKITNLLLILSVAFLASCNQPNQNRPKPMKEVYSVDSVGTLCVKRSKPKELFVAYFPLNSVCEPSNLYSHDINMFITPRGAEFNIETLGQYTKYNSDIATADCAGAGIKTKRQKLLLPAPFTILWNEQTLGVLPRDVGKVYCYKREGKNIEVDNSLVNYFSKLYPKGNTKTAHLCR